ncbi:MAG: LCP family protein [Bacilli bacterium]|nr:LCP family protein [Bacilli bacterium]
MMKWISKVTSFLLTIIFLVVTFMVYRLNLVPIKYFLPIVGILLFTILLLDFKLLRTKTKLFSRIFFNIIAVFIIIILGYGITYLNATYHFMNNLLSSEYEIKNYVVVVNKNQSYSQISDLNQKEMAYLKTDEYYKKVSSKIKKDIQYQEVKKDNIISLVNSFTDEKIPSIVLEREYYNLLREEYQDLEDTKVIKTYKLLVKKKLKKSTKKEDEPFILYISGIDTYGNINSVSRSDVNIVSVIQPKEEKILLVSIPRDYYVQLHGTTGTKDKLTHAGIYGIDMSILTINDLLDIDIDYYLRMNFSTLTKSIDLVGGIDVYSDTAFTSYTNKNITFQQGINHMNGEQALAFARERYAYTTGDRHRGQNQQAIITAIIKKLASVKNITKYKSILESLDGTFETSMSYEELTNLFKLQINKNIDWKIESISLDGVGSRRPTYSMGSRNLYVMIPSDESIKLAKQKITEYQKKGM